MKNLLFKFSILAIFINLVLSACSHWQGDLAKFVISFGGAGRAAYYSATDEETLQQLNHEIIFSNKKDRFKFESKGMTPYESFVLPGSYTVWIYSWLGDDVYAAGTSEADIQAGQDNILTIQMYQAHLVRFDSKGGSDVPYQVVFNNEQAKIPFDPKRGGFNFSGWYEDEKSEDSFKFDSSINNSITLFAKWTAINVPGKNLEDKLNWLYGNAVDGGNYVVTVVSKGESIDSGNRLGYNGKKVIITLTGGAVNLKNIGTMFNIDNGVTLILEEVTLNGLNKNIMPLVIVEGNGKLVMNNESAITENYNNHNNHIGGGAVFVSSGGNFEMNAGAIYNNKTLIDASGGGVFVWGGTFVMNGGDIYFNNSDSSGGGVFVMKSDEVNLIADGTFTMSGGTISGNTSEDGGGVNIWEGGTFDMTGGKIYDNTARRGSGVSVNNNGIFYMKGGEIYNNNNDISDPARQWNGGGVHVNGTFNMSAGEIYGNTAQGGGGVNVYKGTFTMTGGEIYKNTVKQCGGGVNVQSEGKFTKSGGTIYGDDADVNKRNIITATWNGVLNGQAVCVINDDYTGFTYKREKTAGPNDPLDSSKSGTGGGWEN